MGTDDGQPGDAEVAGVMVRPPRLFLAALLAGFVLDRLLPWSFAVPGHPLLGVALMLIGLGLGVAGVRDFSRAATPVRTNQPTRVLVTSGAHGWTRNPIYVGMFLIYGGIGIAARSSWIFVLALPLAIAMRYGVVAREEAYLERRFGAAYREYCARVGRWL